MTNNIVSLDGKSVKCVFDGRAYPEIGRINSRITMQTAKDFLYRHGYITFENLIDDNCNYTIITTGLYKAFCDGVLSLNCTKQDGVINLTFVRVSSGLSGKLDTVLAVTTVSLVNQFCLSRMKIDDLVCRKCYVSESLRIDGIIAYAQNMYVLTHFDLAKHPEYIPQMRADWAKNRVSKKLTYAKNDGKINISDDEIAHLASLKPLCRFESLGDLACSLQAKNYLTISYQNQDFDFALWTKNPAVLAYAIDENGKPENLSTVFSMSRKNIIDKKEVIARYQKYFDHMFIVVDNDKTRDEYLNQDGFYSCHCGHFSCVQCRHCYVKTDNIDTAVERLRDKKQK